MHSGCRSRASAVFCESPDADGRRTMAHHVRNPKRTHFILTSKSGKTLETLALFDYWTQILKNRESDLADQSTVICGAGPSPLREWARRKASSDSAGARRRGRSVFSVDSGRACCPRRCWAFRLRRLRPRRRVGAFASDRWFCSWPRNRSTVFGKRDGSRKCGCIPMRFSVLGLWWQQLWSESLGKRIRAGGPAPRASTPMVCCGPQDQHSLLQQVQEGSTRQMGHLSCEIPTRNGLDLNSQVMFCTIWKNRWNEPRAWADIGGRSRRVSGRLERSRAFQIWS